MRSLTTRCMGYVALLAFAAGTAFADEREEMTPASLRAEVEALRTPDVAWRKIAWKSCLLEGLAESRKQNKPLILWIFIDRPVDDTRC